MNNEFKVSLENIIPLTYARDHFSGIVAEVQKNKMYILTKGGKPAIALIDVRYLEQITAGGINRESLAKDIEKIPEQVGIPKMVQHSPTPSQFRPLKPIPKPAGFAAPQPPKTFEAPPAPANPKPVEPPKPSMPKPEPPSITAPPKPPVSSTPPTPARETPLTMPAPSPVPATPAPPTPPAPDKADQSFASSAQTPPPDSKVDVEFSPEELAKTPLKSSDGSTDPDDKVQPAQYDGEADEKEPDEMPLD